VKVARLAVRRFAADLEVDIDGIVLAVSEAVSNVVMHAYPAGVARGDFELRGRASPSEVTLEIIDGGRGLGDGATTAGAGLGLVIIERLAETVELEDSPGGVALTMRFRRGAA
jgi:anti-sigma regulatory factor (Ser/Thr protein kinase)